MYVNKGVIRRERNSNKYVINNNGEIILRFIHVENILMGLLMICKLLENKLKDK